MWMMSDGKIIEKFGGTFKLAHALGIDPRVVSNWKYRKTGISAVGRYQIKELAERTGVTLPTNFLKQKRIKHNGKR